MLLTDGFPPSSVPEMLLPGCTSGLLPSYICQKRKRSRSCVVSEVVPVMLEGRGSPQVAPDLSPPLPAQLPGVLLPAPLQHIFVCRFPEVQRVPSTLERLPGRRDPLHFLKPRGSNTQRASNASKLPGTQTLVLKETPLPWERCHREGQP